MSANSKNVHGMCIRAVYWWGWVGLQRGAVITRVIRSYCLAPLQKTEFKRSFAYQYAISFMAGKKQVPVSTSETTPIYYLVDSEHSNNLHLLTLIRAFIKFQVTCSLDHHTCTKLVTLWVILSTTSSFSDKQ